MNKSPVFTTMVVAMTLVGCSNVGRGMEGNIYEKMTIFSLITLTAVAAFLISFVGNIGGDKASARFRDLIRNARPHPLSQADLAGNPIYFWDSPKSFQKMVFAKDGSFAESGIVTVNALDPPVVSSGTWALTSAGDLQILRKETTGTRTYARVSQNGYNLATLMRLESGFAAAWHIGEHSLENAQISCFGYSESRPSSLKFTTDLISGLTVYWGTYPCLLPNSSNEVSVNPELAYGLITFHADGTLSKSINNPIAAPPDYRPTFAGTWQIDEAFGVLNMSAGLYKTEVTLLLHSPAHQSLLVGTTAGNEQWFLSQENAKVDLTSYLAIGVHLDAEKRVLFQ